MRLIVAGSRSIASYAVVKSAIDKAIAILEEEDYKDRITIVSGCARGIDTLAIQYAAINNLQCDKFPANWSLGKRAGYLRNSVMANHADALLAIWDGVSPGTKHMINIMQSKGKRVWIRIHKKLTVSSGTSDS